MGENNKLIEQRKIIFQAFVELYLTKNNIDIKEKIPDYKDEYGVLTLAQAQILHFYLLDEYKKSGKDLIEEIKNSGEEVVPGKLSNYEISVLIRKADELANIVSILEQRKARKDLLINGNE